MTRYAPADARGVRAVGESFSLPPCHPRPPITLKEKDSCHGQEEKETARGVPERVPLPAVPGDTKRDGEEHDGEDEFGQEPPHGNRTAAGHGNANLGEERYHRQEEGDPPERVGERA